MKNSNKWRYGIRSSATLYSGFYLRASTLPEILRIVDEWNFTGFFKGAAVPCYLHGAEIDKEGVPFYDWRPLRNWKEKP